MTYERKPERCEYCDLLDREVEAGGIYHCPNPLCFGCGAWWFRVLTAGYANVDSHRHTVDVDEIVAFGQWLVAGLDECDPRQHAVARSLLKWQELRVRDVARQADDQYDCGLF